MTNNYSIACTLLIDDDKVINFYNEKIVNRHNDFGQVTSVNSGQNALDYLKDASNGLIAKPDLIFLDINMPAMNGWEFIEEFNKIDSNFTSSIKVILLTTSNNPDDFKRSKTIKIVSDFINKPLTADILDHVKENHYILASSKKT
ncbi:MAG: response regulator [Oceanihabitans sp.]|nr:response regulator [Oceanihabitans sp.]